MTNYRLYNHTNPAPTTRPCGCGKCGLTFERIISNRRRVWAVGCPVKAEIEKAKWREKHKQREERRRVKRESYWANVEAERAKAKLWRMAREAAKDSDDEPLYSQGTGRICSVCCGMSWRRKFPRCPKCRQLYADAPPLEHYPKGRSNICVG